MEDFQELFFEISSEERYSILLLLRKKSSTITDISKSIGITSQEASRHVYRLIKLSMVDKDSNGVCHITPYSELILKLVMEFQFISKNREYFASHVTSKLPFEFIERFGELKDCNPMTVIDFLHSVNHMITTAREYVWLCVNEYPVTALGPIREALGKKIRFRVIEPRGISSKPELDIETSEMAQALAGTRRLPLGQQKIVDRVYVFMSVTDTGCAFAFPTREGKFDYIGFSSSDEEPREWCKDLFEHLWSKPAVA